MLILTVRPHNQTKTIEATSEALSLANNPNLPPLMNPTMLEASDDLTNLSHLNEPAGMASVSSGRGRTN
jgi:myosin-5